MFGIHIALLPQAATFYPYVSFALIGQERIGKMVKKLYVGNLSWGTTEDSLKELFSKFGQVSSASIITDKQSGRSRGFGFVEMENADEAMHALNGKEFQGRSIKVSEATGRKPKSVGDYGHSGYGGSDEGTIQW